MTFWAGLAKVLLETFLMVSTWFKKSPGEKTQDKIGETHEAVRKAKDSRGDFSDMDDLS